MKIEKLKSGDYVGLLIAITLIVFAVVSRILPHPSNFAPIAAIAIFGGALLPRKLALSLPLAAMVLSDLILGLHPLIMFTWGSFVLIALASSYRFKKITSVGVVGGSIGASVLFYLITNFGVWIEGRLYAPTFSGLVQCYYNALPFFKSTLLGDMVYACLLFGVYAFARRMVKSSSVVKLSNTH